MKKVGLFFGSFNPIHVGHLVIADHMALSGNLDEVWMVISPHNPHKEKKSLLADNHRLALVKEAIEDNPRLRASDIEFGLPIPSYTSNTLAYLKEKYPDTVFSLIMGEDNLRTFHKWKNYEDILANHHIFVYPRVLTVQELEKEKKEENQLHNHPSIQLVNDAPMMKISSSFIRKSIARGVIPKYILTEPVRKYIDEMNFYK